MGLLRRLTRGGQLAALMATHDLELALRTADVVWLLMPGGELVAGAPEDVVLAGGIAQAFEGRHTRFHPDDRTFRMPTQHRGAALVREADFMPRWPGRCSSAKAMTCRMTARPKTAG